MKKYLIADLRNFQILGEYHTHNQATNHLESEFEGWDFSVCTKKQFAEKKAKADKDYKEERMSLLTHFTRDEEKEIVKDYDRRIEEAEDNWTKNFLKRAKENFFFRDYNL